MYSESRFFDFAINGSALRIVVYAIDAALILLTLATWLGLFFLYPELLKLNIFRSARLAPRQVCNHDLAVRRLVNQYPCT